ncbi:MAG: hypothetical protein JWQ86_3135 [Mycobacterium sp.]|jgi:hypothetical protein|nr:hypothetical protein [Mycobacterium sp.]
MDLVLGLSMTSKDIRGVLVDGVTGEAAHVDRAVLDVPDVDAFDAEAFLESLLVEGDLHTVGLTWSQDAEPVAIKVREALDVLSGGAPVVAVPDVEAAEALARGIADITGNDFLVVCIVEPDAAVIATVDGHRVAVETIDRADSATLIDRARAVVRSARPSPDAVYVLGSADTDELVSALTDATPRPVITATEADFALTRGAALASARATNVPDAPVARKRISRVGVLSAVLAAAVVVFVVSVSLVMAMPVTPDPSAQPSDGSAAGHSARPSAPQLMNRDAPALSLTRQPFAEVAPPVPEVVPPAAPAYVPPAPPVYAPPAPPPQPRLRDRIIDKIPLVNRFR